MAWWTVDPTVKLILGILGTLLSVLFVAATDGACKLDIQ